MTGGLHEVFPVDQVARWEALRATWPEASYAVDGGGWFYGALRDADDVLRSATLENLIDRLTARESCPDREGILAMWHYCTRTHHHEVWIEIYRSTHWGFCYGCHRQHTWL
jgi:hypothetical protein